MKSLYDENEFLTSKGMKLKIEIWNALKPIMKEWYKGKEFRAREISELISAVAHLLSARQIADSRMIFGSAADKVIGKLHRDRR